ncbi:MAG: Uma2 family endonuclease [Frankiaceae bacterium]|nr:Uma2 family endonuclease [Frankiaceae bacterium]
MRTVVLGERPAELEALIEKRRRLGLDGHDEVWDGVYVMAPHAHSDHGIVEEELRGVLFPRAKAGGLIPGSSFNVGEPDDFRVPDGGYHRTRPGTLYVPTAAMVIEVLSPDDETFAKFDFYARHGIDEILVADPDVRTVRCWQLIDAGYVEQPRSALLDVDMAALEAEVAWPR